MNSHLMKENLFRRIHRHVSPQRFKQLSVLEGKSEEMNLARAVAKRNTKNAAWAKAKNLPGAPR